MTEKQFEILVNKNIHNFTPIYGKGKEVNPIPEKTNCVVYCEGSNDYGWVEIKDSPDELGLSALIAKSWITKEALLKLA